MNDTSNDSSIDSKLNDTEISKTSSEENTTIAGIIRSMFRDLIRRTPSALGRINLGSIPQPKPKIRSVARSAEKISDLFDYHAIYRQLTNSSPEDQHEKSHSHEKNTSKWHPKRIKILLVRGMMELAANSMLGSILFSCYTSSFKMLVDKKMFGDEGNCIAAMVSGGFGGSLHGGLTYAMMTMTMKIRSMSSYRHLLAPPPSLNTSLLGLIFSHVLVHASLFGSYEYFKHQLIHSSSSGQGPSIAAPVEEEDEEMKVMKQLLAITSAGFIAGMISESLAHYTSCFEDRIIHTTTANQPASSCMRSRMHVLASRWKSNGYYPNIRSVLFASIPSAFGFLAYEVASQSSFLL
jgi:hypothetical protein